MLTSSANSQELLLSVATKLVRLSLRGPGAYRLGRGTTQAGAACLAQCPDAVRFHLAGPSGAPLFLVRQTYALLLTGPAGRGLELRPRDSAACLDAVSAGENLVWGSVRWNAPGRTGLEIWLDGAPYLTLELEAFPSRLSYREDRASLLEALRQEVLFRREDWSDVTQSFEAVCRALDRPARALRLAGKMPPGFPVPAPRSRQALQTAQAILGVLRPEPLYGDLCRRAGAGRKAPVGPGRALLDSLRVTGPVFHAGVDEIYAAWCFLRLDRLLGEHCQVEVPVRPEQVLALGQGQTVQAGYRGRPWGNELQLTWSGSRITLSSPEGRRFIFLPQYLPPAQPAPAGKNTFVLAPERDAGCLPFFPGAEGEMVENIRQTILPWQDGHGERQGIPQSLAAHLEKVDWSAPDVLVGTLRDRRQLDICLEHRFYHLPQAQLEAQPGDIRWVAIYQSQNLFGWEAGIRFCAPVEGWSLVKRREIQEIPRRSDELYYRFALGPWQALPRPIAPGPEGPAVKLLTNRFLLLHSLCLPELLLTSEDAYCLHYKLRQMAASPMLNTGTTLSFPFRGALLRFSQGQLLLERGPKRLAAWPAAALCCQTDRVVQDTFAILENGAATSWDVQDDK